MTADYFVSDRRGLLQLDRVHAFLSTKAYWCLGIPYSTVARAAANSLCFGVYRDLGGASAADKRDEISGGLGSSAVEQVGFARVVTDSATFAYLCDVYIEDSARGHGLSKMLMKAVMAHPDLQGLRRFCLATKDAHKLYEQFGFSVTKSPQNWMEIKDDLIYSHKA